MGSPNKVKINISNPYNILPGFNKNKISVGISSDYNSTYSESCFTGWYQSVSAQTGTSYTVISEKTPGGSLLFTGDSYVTVDDPNGYLTFGCNDFTLEAWVNVQPSIVIQDYSVPIVTNQGDGNTNTSDGFSIIASFNENSNTIRFIASASTGNTTVFNFNSITSFNPSTWYHICLTRNNKESKYAFAVNGTWYASDDTGNGCIAGAISGITIGNTSTLNSNTKRISIHDLRFLIGFAKYDIKGFTPPIYPISAIFRPGIIGFSTPLLLNVFQESKMLNNSGIQNFTYRSDYVTWSNSRANKENKIPSIYNFSATSIGQFRTQMNIIAKNKGYTQNLQNMQEITDWYRDRDDIFINNFDYEDIPKSGLTYCYDPQHIMSFPLATIYDGNYTGTSLYNLVNLTDEVVLDIRSPNAYDRSSESLSTSGGSLTIKDVTIAESFSVVFVFKKEKEYNYGDYPIISGSSNYSFLIRTGSGIKPGKGLTFVIYDSNGSPLEVLSGFSNYTNEVYNMFILTSNGSDKHVVFLNGQEIGNSTSFIQRINIVDDINITDNDIPEVDFYFKIIYIYERALNGDEALRLYNNLANRLKLLT